jgi:hypothetical protein
MYPVYTTNGQHNFSLNAAGIEEKEMSRFAVIDTETTWSDMVMSIGIVIAESDTFELIDKRYYIITPYKNYGGMYTDALYANNLERTLSVLGKGR